MVNKYKNWLLRNELRVYKYLQTACFRIGIVMGIMYVSRIFPISDVRLFVTSIVAFGMWYFIKWHVKREEKETLNKKFEPWEVRKKNGTR